MRRLSGIKNKSPGNCASNSMKLTFRSDPKKASDNRDAMCPKKDGKGFCGKFLLDSA
jgi:hypothetical protein